MNTNYIHKYIKYKNRYIKYINQYGGKCQYSIEDIDTNKDILDLQKLNDDFVTENTYTDSKCLSIEKLVTIMDTNVRIPDKSFPYIGIDGKNMTIHDIWNTIITNNRISKDINNKSSSKYIYEYNMIQFYFIHRCLNILRYDDIYSYNECSNKVITDNTVLKLSALIGTMYTKLYNKDHISTKIKYIDIKSDSISGYDIVKILLNELFFIICNKKEYIYLQDDISNIFDNNELFGRKIKDNNNFHLSINILVLYIYNKTINNKQHGNYWPKNAINVYSPLSLHIIWSSMVKYNKITNVFIYTKIQYDFINYCLMNTLDNIITKISDINNITFKPEILKYITLTWKFINIDETNIKELSKNILKKLIYNIRSIILNSKKFYNYEQHKYDINKSSTFYVVDIDPVFPIKYNDDNIYVLPKNNISYLTIKNYMENYIKNIFKLSEIINLFKTYIIYIDIYKIIPDKIILNIQIYNDLCMEYANNYQNKLKMLIFNLCSGINNLEDNLKIYENDERLIYLKNFNEKIIISCNDNIKNLLDLSNIVICVFLNNMHYYNIINFTQTKTLYETINKNMITYFKNNKYTITDLIEYTQVNIFILLNIKILLPVFFNTRNQKINDLCNRLYMSQLNEKNLIIIKYLDMNKIEIIESTNTDVIKFIQYFNFSNEYININNIYNDMINFKIIKSIYQLINYILYNMIQNYIELNYNTDINKSYNDLFSLILPNITDKYDIFIDKNYNNIYKLLMEVNINDLQSLIFSDKLKIVEQQQLAQERQQLAQERQQLAQERQQLRQDYQQQLDIQRQQQEQQTQLDIQRQQQEQLDIQQQQQEFQEEQQLYNQINENYKALMIQKQIDEERKQQLREQQQQQLQQLDEEHKNKYNQMTIAEKIAELSDKYHNNRKGYNMIFMLRDPIEIRIKQSIKYFRIDIEYISNYLNILNNQKPLVTSNLRIYLPILEDLLIEKKDKIDRLIREIMRELTPVPGVPGDLESAHQLYEITISLINSIKQQLHNIRDIKTPFNPVLNMYPRPGVIAGYKISSTSIN